MIYNNNNRLNLGRIAVDTTKKSNLEIKRLPPDAIAKGPNKKVPVERLLGECAG